MIAKSKDSKEKEGSGGKGGEEKPPCDPFCELSLGEKPWSGDDDKEAGRAKTEPLHNHRICEQIIRTVIDLQNTRHFVAASVSHRFR